MYRLQLTALDLADRLGARLRDQRGQGTMEYVLIIAVLVVAILAILFMFRDRLQGWIDQAASTIDGWMT